MARIRSENTKPEIFVRKKLFARGYRYRIHKKGLPGKPDLYLRKYRTAVFVHGCFWHRHRGCRLAYMPKSNTEFWNKKFETNIARDQRQAEELKSQNIRVLIVWECTVRKMMKDDSFAEQMLDRMEEFFQSADQNLLEL